MHDPKFIHLRVHTAYSLALGAIPVPKLIKQLKEWGVPACAITDRGNLFSLQMRFVLVLFRQKCNQFSKE